MSLASSMEDYLEAVFIVQKRCGTVRSIDVAEQLGFTKPSVSRAVKVLINSGHLIKQEDGCLVLTDKGKLIAEQIYERHCFFTDQLIAAGVNPKTAEQDACNIEHSISADSFQKLKAAVEKKEDLH